MTDSHAQAPPRGGWPLDDFLDAVAEEMTRLGIAAAPPDRRTIRYYATIGVLEKPALVGREARYHQRQLSQILAIKRLQTAGVRLAAITSRLEGASTADLDTLATTSAPPNPTPAPSAQPPGAFRQTVMVLAPGVRLVLDADLNSTEVSVINQAARGLVDRITALGLTGPDPKEDPDAPEA